MKDKLRCILDPKEVHGETFRVLKEKEVRLYGDAPQSNEVVSIRILGQVRRIR